MQISSCIPFAAATALFLSASALALDAAQTPLVPGSGSETTPIVAPAEAQVGAAPYAEASASSTTPASDLSIVAERAWPVRARIPSIALDAPIEGMGINDAGEMDVPDGRTDKVGWYKYGATPGEAGSAVFDAHVYAAFRNLHRVKVGDEISVDMTGGKTLRFVVSDTAVYPLEEVSADELFNRADGRYLHLITCAGNWDAARDTYDSRLIVHATLAE